MEYKVKEKQGCFSNNQEQISMEEVKAIFEEQFGRPFDGDTMYKKITIEEEIFIANVCEEHNIDFSIGTNHFTLFNK